MARTKDVLEGTWAMSCSSISLLLPALFPPVKSSPTIPTPKGKLFYSSASHFTNLSLSLLSTLMQAWSFLLEMTLL